MPQPDNPPVSADTLFFVVDYFDPEENLDEYYLLEPYVIRKPE